MLEITIRRQTQGAPTQFQFENDALEKTIRDSAGSPAYEGHPGSDAEALQLICITALGSGVIVTPAELPKQTPAQKRGDGPRTPVQPQRLETVDERLANPSETPLKDFASGKQAPGTVRAQAPGIRTPIQEQARETTSKPSPEKK